MGWIGVMNENVSRGGHLDIPAPHCRGLDVHQPGWAHGSEDDREADRGHCWDCLGHWSDSVYPPCPRRTLLRAGSAPATVIAPAWVICRAASPGSLPFPQLSLPAEAP